MDNLKAKLALINVIISKIKAEKVADLITLSAFFIVFYNTFLLNRSIGMYILAVELFITSYFVARR